MTLGLKKCPKCGQLYTTKTCENCTTRKAEIDGCQIEEAQGRCQEYYDGICEMCLNYCAQEDWKGWRKIDGS